MKAMIFAAGLGTRLKPITDTMPKALVPICDTPLLEILIRKLIACGFDEIVINIHHFGQQIIDFLQEKQNFGINIQISDERDELLDTGGGIKKAAPLLLGDHPFLVHNVDILSNVNLESFYKENLENDATLLVSERETSRYLLFNEKNRLMGWTNLQTGEVKSPYPDLDIHSCKMYAFAGIHLFSPRLLPLMDSYCKKFSIIDFYLSIAKDINIKGFPISNLHLMDVGKLNTLHLAEEFRATGQDQFK